MRLWSVLLCLALLMALPRVAHADVDVALARAEAPLNGPWAFRFGNDPAWASAEFDDRDWERVDLTPSPGAHDGDVACEGTSLAGRRAAMRAARVTPGTGCACAG